MFEVSVRSVVLKQVIGVVSTLVDEAKFSVDKDGIRIKAVDPAHVAMVDLNLSKDAFEEYRADECELGIDIDKLKEVLKLARGDEIITIKHNEEKNNLIINIENITRRMSLIDTAGMSDPKVPSLNLPVKVVMRANELDQGIKASESVSDHIALIVNPDGFELRSEGDTDSVDLKLSKELLKELDCKDEVKSLFSLDYFSNMIKSVSGAELVTMHLGSDYPVKLEFDIAEGNGHVVYLLAPRIESD